MNSTDILIVQMMRNRTTSSARGSYVGKKQILYIRLEVKLEKFIDLLIDFDPFAARFSHVLDPSMTLFELQMLYLLSEARKKNILAVKELLNWWFPLDVFSQALLIINDIVDILNLSNERWGLESQYKEKLLLAYAGRSRSFSTTEKTSFDARQSASVLNTIFIH